MTVKVTMPNNSSDSVDFINATGTTLAQVKAYDDGSSNGHLELYTTASGTSTERVRVTSAGNVGIGTSSPTVYGSYKTLEVRGTGGGLLQIGTGASTAAYLFQDGTNAGFNNIANGVITLGTNNTERARIDTSGNLLVGTTSAFGSQKICVSFDGASAGGIGFVTTSNNTYSAAKFFNSSGSQVGSISVTASATAYNTSSDYRLKNSVAPMTGALEKVAALKPVTYKWNVDGSDGEGFIAHELAEVCPNAVAGEKDAVDADGNPVYQGIDTSFLVATLTAAIQEQQALISSQAAAIQTLTERVNALENK